MYTHAGSSSSALSSVQWKPYPKPGCSTVTHQFVGGQGQLHRHVLQAPTFDPVLEAGQGQLPNDAENGHPHLRGQSTDVLGARGSASCTQPRDTRQPGSEGAVVWKGSPGLPGCCPLCPPPHPGDSACLIQGTPLSSSPTQEPHLSPSETGAQCFLCRVAPSSRSPSENHLILLPGSPGLIHGDDTEQAFSLYPCHPPGIEDSSASGSRPSAPVAFLVCANPHRPELHPQDMRGQPLGPCPEAKLYSRGPRLQWPRWWVFF